MPSPTDGSMGRVFSDETGPQAATSGRPDGLLPALRAQDAPPAAARRPLRSLLAGVAALLILGTGLAVWQPWAPAPPQVMVESAALAPVARVLAVNGRVAGEGAVDIRPLVSGRVTALPVRAGDMVKAGTVLARIDSRAQAAVLRQALAGLDAALVAQEAADAALARANALGASTSRVDQDAALRAQRTARQEVARLTAVLEQAEVALSLYTVTAPVSGTVTDLPVALGQTVDPATTLMTMADMEDLVVEAVVDESHALELREGMSAVMRLTGSPLLLDGRVTRVARQVDAATGGLAVTLAPDAPLQAPIGLTVTVNLTIEDRAEAITVPRAAVVTDAAGTAVFLLQGTVAARRPVSVIEWPAARLIVTEGLSPGDPVIADATGLAEGMTVSVAGP